MNNKKSPTFLKVALSLAKRNLYVFPLKPNTKKEPRVKWGTKATINTKIINHWWQTPGWNNSNIAIATKPSNLTVLDIDVKKDSLGLESLKALEKKYGKLPKTLTISTPSGGLHYYFTGLTQQIVSGALGKGIDTRSAGGTHGGYVVGPYSVLDNGKYKIINTGKIAPLPIWLKELLGDYNPNLEKQISSSNVIEEDLDSSISWAIDYLSNTAAIATENQGGNSTVFKVSARLRDYGISQDKAKKLMWKYYSPRCDPPWEGYEEQFEEYIKNGYTYSHHTAPGASNPIYQFSSEVAPEEPMLKEKNGSRPYDVEGFVYLSNQNKYINRISKKSYTSTVFNQLETRNHFMPKGCKSISDKIKSGEAIIRECFDVGYKPVDKEFIKDEDGDILINGYKCADIEPLEGDISMFIDHMNYLIEDKNAREHIINFMAHTIQRPLDKIYHAILIQSDWEGIGKSFLVIALRAMLGKNNVSIVESDDVSAKENSWSESKRVVGIEELMGIGKNEIRNKLKPLIASDTIQIKEKYLVTNAIDNYANVFIFTNYKDAIPMSNKDRRYHITFCDQEPRSDTYYTKLFDWLLKEKGANYLINWLKNKDLSNFVSKNKAPITSSKIEMAAITADPFEQLVINKIEENQYPFNKTIITVQEVAEYIRTTRTVRDNIGIGQLKSKIVALFKHLNKSGKVYKIKKQGEIRKDGVKYTKQLWMLHRIENAEKLENLTAAALYKYHDDQQDDDLNDFVDKPLPKSANVLDFKKKGDASEGLI